jgi:uncharacterized protein YggE
VKRTVLWLCVLFLSVPAARAQNQEPKVILDTLVVQTEGTIDADPDLATLSFDVSALNKELKPAYDRASQSIQKIVALADRNGLKKGDISSGVLTVSPSYDRKNRAKSFFVHGHVVVRVRDFSKLGEILEGAMSDEITDFRSLSYTLENEEAAKERAVAEAMRRAIGRANAALEQKGQKVGALRFASIDARQLVVYAQLQGGMTQSLMVQSPGAKREMPPPPPPPLPQPEKITISATVQCGFQIQ